MSRADRGLRRPRLAAAGIALFFVAESTALPYELSPWKDEPPEVYRWLAGPEAKPGPIVELLVDMDVDSPHRR